MESQDQELEALKKWWQENGRMVVAGLVIGLGGVFGYTSWQSYQQRQSELASQLYAELTATFAEEKHEQALLQADGIIEEYSGTGYGALAALLAAASAQNADQPDAARAHLEWVIENSAIEGLKDLARLRLAHLLADRNDLATARSTVEAISSDEYAALADELRGDIALADGNPDVAAETYRKAMESEAVAQDARARMQMKLDDIGRYNIK